MPRLKSRNHFPPVYFRYLQPETGWDSTKFVGQQGIDAVARALLEHRKGNKHLAEKHGWKMDYGQIVDEVDEFTAILNLKAGHYDYVATDSPPNPLKPLTSSLPGNVAAAAGAKRIVGGLKAFIELFGEEGSPVAHDEAERRAAICAVCPKNDKDLNWIEKFETGAAHLLKMQLSIRHDMKLETSKDKELGLCAACGCPMELKVHAPLEFIRKRTNSDVMMNLHSSCWIPKEANG